jgi:hypothetical protein
MQSKLFKCFLSSFCFCNILLSGLLDNMGLDSEVVLHESEYSCIKKSPAKPPAQHSGAESLPPLPLPAVPLRRTEKKNPPRPPVLIAKMSTNQHSDWNSNPADTRNLLRWMSKNLNVHFSSINMPEIEIPNNPQEIVIYFIEKHVFL